MELKEFKEFINVLKHPDFYYYDGFKGDGKKIEGMHFDTQQYNFITWNMENLTDFKTKLQNRIEATIGRGPLDQENR